MGSVGPYTLLRRIALGGMAEVFLARRDGPAGFAKIVALKRILPHLATLPDFVAMFHDEARLAARLTHPNIVQIYDFGRSDGAYFIAMEYVAGEDLLSVVQRARELAVPFPPALVATILAAACEGLHHAHQLTDDTGTPLGLVHRDVTPSNLLVSYDGVVKLADFGVAKAETSAAPTAAGALKGKYAYMSPEQALGHPIDHRSDVFSLGIVGHELLTGQRLFRREGELAVLKAITDAPVPPPRRLRPDVPASLEATVMRALERDPARRWPTAQAMQLALEEYLAAEATAGARIRLAGFLLRLFGEAAAATRRRWANGDLGDGEPTASTSGKTGAAPPPAPRSASHSGRSSTPGVPTRRVAKPATVAHVGSSAGRSGWLLAGAMMPLAILGAVELALRVKERLA